MSYAQMQPLLNAAYNCCTNDQAYANGELPWEEQLAALMRAEVERVWKLKGMPEKLNNELTAAYASIFMQGLQEGYGLKLGEIDYNTPDADMLNNLTQNVYAFSAAKNYTQLQQLTKALIGDDGKLSTYSQFKRAAFTISNEHNLGWLKAEYDTAIGSAQMARKWVQIQANKSSLPLLQFDAVIDGRTSDKCRPLEGIIKPVDDKFWDTYYPPNHFRCRSSVKQLSTGKITPNNAITTPEKMPAMFKTNLAKTGMLFPPTHPYWTGIPTKVYEQTIKLLPYDMQFEHIDWKVYGGRLRQHKLLKKTSDYATVLEIAKELAERGSTVDIMPVINQLGVWRDKIFPDGKRLYSPDLRVDGILVDVKNPDYPFGKSTLSHHISDGSKQASKVLINLKGEPDINLENLVKGKFKNHKTLEEVIFRRNGVYKHYKK